MIRKEVIQSFIQQINLQSVEGICSLMTDNHIFIDNIGNEHKGKEKMREGWKSYFDMFPDYKIEITEMMHIENSFLLCGFAQGTFQNSKEKEAYFKIPAAWKAIIEGEKIKLWQVFADTKAQFDVMKGK